MSYYDFFELGPTIGAVERGDGPLRFTDMFAQYVHPSFARWNGSELIILCARPIAHWRVVSCDDRGIYSAVRT